MSTYLRNNDDVILKEADKVYFPSQQIAIESQKTDVAQILFC